mgnify:CR=1 FL=1
MTRISELLKRLVEGGIEVTNEIKKVMGSWIQIKWNKLNTKEYFEWYLLPPFVNKMDLQLLFFLKATHEKNIALIRDIKNNISLIQLGSALSYTFFNPIVYENRVIVPNEHINDSALCKTTQAIKNIYIREALRHQQIKTSNESRLDNTTFNLILETNSTFENLNLPYTRIFAEQYDFYIANIDGLATYDMYGIPTDFFDIYEFTLSESDAQTAEDVLDYGGIAKLYFTNIPLCIIIFKLSKMDSIKTPRKKDINKKISSFLWFVTLFKCTIININVANGPIK